jgi:peptidyl-prolyl cis-trans isomerase C
VERIAAMHARSTILMTLAVLGVAAGAGVRAEEPAAPTKAAKAAPTKAAEAAPTKATKTAKAAPTQAEAGPSKAAAQDPADIARRAQVLVKFDGGQVTVGDLEDAIARQSPFMRKRYQKRAELEKLLEKTLQFELLAREAERQGFGDRPSVQQAVKQNAVQAMMKHEFDEKMSAESVPAEAVKAYYDEHVDEYVRPAMRRASHILVATRKEASELLAQAKAADLREFRQLAREKTADEATKLRGGDLRYFDSDGRLRGQEEPTVAPAIARAVFKLKNVGDTAPAPVKVEGGFSIVKLTGQRPALSRTLQEVQDTIRLRLWRKQRQDAIEAMIKRLRKEHPPELHAGRVEWIELDEPDLPAGLAHGRPGHGKGQDESQSEDQTEDQTEDQAEDQTRDEATAAE